MQHPHQLLMAVCIAATGVVSCSPSIYPDSGDAVYYRKLADAGHRLGLRISDKDDQALFIIAADWLGTPYRYGGNSRKGVDCSGLARILIGEAYGIDLPPGSGSQLEACKRRVSRHRLRCGDLLFFGPKGKKRNINHVGVYLKDDRFIHASNRGVIVSSLNEEYYVRTYVCAGRP